MLTAAPRIVSFPFPPVPTLEIFPGVNLPMQGLGTWLYNDTRAEAAVELALSLGYVHIDTAFDYQNSAGIGRAFASAKAKYGRDRESYFITTKARPLLIDL